jgi:HlyD family secretion protein
VLLSAVFVVLLAAAVLVLYGGFGRIGASPSPTPTTSLASSTAPAVSPSATPRPTQVSTPRPSPSPVDTSIRAAAVVVPQRSAELALPVSGVIGGLYVRENEAVALNRILLRLDQSTYIVALDAAEAAVVTAQAALVRAQLQVDQLPPDATPGDVESAQADLRLAEAELELAQTNVSSAQVALQQTELRAPFAGTVADVSVELGEQAIAGQPIVALGDLDGWLIETTDLSELEVVRIAVGDQATVTFTAFPDLVVTGRVDRIQVRGTTDTGGVRFAVSIRPDAHHPELRWNMSGEVRITPSR